MPGVLGTAAWQTFEFLWGCDVPHLVNYCKQLIKQVMPVGRAVLIQCK